MNIDEDVRVKIKEVVADVLEIPENEMTLTSRFKEDHNADSLGAIMLLAKLEKMFPISIPQTELSRMVNLEGIFTVVAETPVSR
ncbi:MAG TPA: acyl carrier protein [Polyangiaceae bacterium]|nr:acyl carrier protein [Polyangiaceae bacterium]